MKNIFKTSLSVLFVMIIAGCSQEKAKEEALYNQVMAVHDEVMPETGTLMKLTKELKVELDSVMSNDMEDQDQRIIALTELIADLESANESMMQWMRNFEPVTEGTPHGEVIQFLMEEKEKVDKVKQDMMGAKDNAEKYFLENQ